MTAWCALLVAQASLIRVGRRPLHRSLGRASYALVALVVLSTANDNTARRDERLPRMP